MRFTADSPAANSGRRASQTTSNNHDLNKLTQVRAQITSKAPVARSRWGALELCREAMRKRDYFGANSRYEQLLRSARSRGDTRTAARVLCDLAFLYRILGETAKADVLYKDAYKAWKSLVAIDCVSSISDYIHCLLDYAAFLRNAGRCEDALKLEARAEQKNPLAFTPQFACSRAELLEARGQDQDAERAYEQALIDATMSPDFDLQLRVLNQLVPLYRRTGQTERADAMNNRRLRLQKIKSVRLWETHASDAREYFENEPM
jgi:tetratricopeptide (TPR) repeat protein